MDIKQMYYIIVIFENKYKNQLEQTIYLFIYEVGNTKADEETFDQFCKCNCDQLLGQNQGLFYFSEWIFGIRVSGFLQCINFGLLLEVIFSTGQQFGWLVTGYHKVTRPIIFFKVNLIFGQYCLKQWAKNNPSKILCQKKKNLLIQLFQNK
eukprot:TRINITY_DN33108_c1_g1_i7.p3 TRINITY_DN33108_c1_g1~~TRINITY_DN33108_c1_g1_i7.p3  ORF type:complete len:151 (+),score=4.81 TRINITY_DN33108_c1_g1_i7:10-462(+)